MGFSDAVWRKSSYSGTETNCIEIAYPDWRKSSYSGTETECIEIAYPVAAPTVGIRDSKNPTGGYLTFPHTALHRLIRTITD